MNILFHLTDHDRCPWEFDWVWLARNYSTERSWSSGLKLFLETYQFCTMMEPGSRDPISKGLDSFEYRTRYK